MSSDPQDDAIADCTAVLTRLYEFLDGECAEVEADEIRSHLDACDRCVEDADVALALKALVQRCCRAVEAPPTLRMSIITSCRTTAVTNSGVTHVQYTEISTVHRTPPA